MKNSLNNIFGISQRFEGTIDNNGYVKIDKILSYDIVGDPPFTDAKLLTEKLMKELQRQELLKSRREKINRLNNLSE